MKSFALAAALAVLPVTGFADTVSIDTFAGPVALDASPETVVVLDLAAIDTLDALSVRAAAVPTITPPAHLAQAMVGLPSAGSLFEPDFERLAALGPDLIIAGGRSQKQVDPLGRIAPTLDMTIGNDVPGQMRARLRAYGTLFGLEAEAAALLAGFDAKVDAARAATEGKGTALILLTNGGTVSAYGAQSRFGWLHSLTGLAEAAADIDADTHGESVSFEYIAETNPDWLLVVDRAAAIGREGEAAAVTLDNPLIAGTKAGETGQILYLDSAALYLSGGGIQSMQRILDQITAAFTQAQG